MPQNHVRAIVGARTFTISVEYRLLHIVDAYETNYKQYLKFRAEFEISPNDR